MSADRRPMYDALIGHWQEGQRRLAEADPQDRRALDRVVDAIVDELRRRLGGKFSVDELAQLYLDQGTDWCFAIATRVEPSNPAAWDLTTVAGAAFARYAREAADYTVGRRLGGAETARRLALSEPLASAEPRPL